MNDWIEYDGGDGRNQPPKGVELWTKVEVRYPDQTTETDYASEFVWSHKEGDPLNIVAYRLVSE